MATRLRIPGVITLFCLALMAAAPGLRLVSKSAKTFATRSAFPHDSPAPQVDKAANRLTYASQSPTILAEAGPEGNMMSFQIAGLTNPEIRVPAGAEIHFVVVNVDDDMVHDLVLTNQPPPYPAKPGISMDLGTPGLAPHKTGPYRAALLTVKITTPATDYYLCTVTGHAKAGMYGKLTITAK